MNELKDKVAIISGAGGALGSVVAQRLHHSGAKLALIDRNEENLQKIVQEHGIPNGESLLGAVDLTQSAEIAAFMEQVVAQFGKVDVLVNVAGGFVYSGAVHEMKFEDWDAMLTINAKTAFLLSAIVAKQMVTQGSGGRIVMVGARAALKGDAGLSAYCASKAAVLRLTESMAAELLEHHITVNAVLPSTIDTPANRKSMPDADFEKWVKPESLADVIAFLASEAARDISGAAIPVYGRS